jgi:hypothetical protein
MRDVSFDDAVGVQEEQIAPACDASTAIHTSGKARVVGCGDQANPWKFSSETSRSSWIAFMVDYVDFEIVGEKALKRPKTLLDFRIASIIDDQDRNQKNLPEFRCVTTITILSRCEYQYVMWDHGRRRQIIVRQLLLPWPSFCYFQRYDDSKVRAFRRQNCRVHCKRSCRAFLGRRKRGFGSW